MTRSEPVWLATGNQGKVDDFAAMAPGLRLDLMPGFPALPSVEETGDTFEANARLKAEHYSRLGEGLIVADDSGLVVDALAGAPGVYSARYAGLHGDDDANNRLVLQRLQGIPIERRTARFVCVLALARRGKFAAVFHGVAEGLILPEERGTLGFGYDPLFYSPAAGCGFGELTRERKAAFSHRGQAARALLEWMRSAGAGAR
ncbi:MAG: RdgB/HAM1 family non-canonical purine NTP pyrophosphatase [Terriglobales bacterium]